MVSSTCGHDNRAGAKFCATCGQSLLPAACGQCAAELAPGARFCDECGTPVAGAQSPAPAAPAGTLPPSGPPSGLSAGRSRSILHSALRSSATGSADRLVELDGGRYRVERLLGEGATKRVYLGLDTRLDREVAVALIKTEGLDDDGLRRVRREIDAMVRLGDHANIVTVLDAGIEDGRPWIVSELMRRGSLADRLAASDHRQLPVADVLRIARQLVAGLDHIHQRGVVHRDLKPANVWMADDDSVRLGDFGLAMLQDRTRVSMAGAMLGTVAYMAPEQIAGRGVTGAADLYSLGCMLYELLTGRPPFTGDDAVAVISQHLNTAPVPPSWHVDTLGAGVDALVGGLLEKTPERRPVAAALLASIDSLALAPETSGVRVASSTAGVARLHAAPFIGRQSELGTVRGAVEEAVSGRGSVIVVSGDAGIGKSRLVDEVAAFARVRRVRVLRGRAVEDEGAPAYWPWIQILRAYLQDAPPDRVRDDLRTTAADLAQIVPEVGTLLPGLPAPPTLEPEQARFRLFDAVAQSLRRSSAAQPQLVVVDDLHVADASSLRLLRHVAREVADMHLVLLVTSRPTSADGADPLAEIVDDRAVTHLPLAGLTLAEVEQLLAAVSNQDLGEPERELAELLRRETAGNPFHLEELLRHLVESGAIYRQGGRWQGDADALARVRSLAGVSDLIAHRLDGLPREVTAALGAASVIGREFDADVLTAVTGVEASDLLGAPGMSDVLEAAGSGRHRFRHNLVWEALYAQVPAEERRSLHRRVGEAVERLRADEIERHLGRLANHFAESGHDPALVADYARRAAEQALTGLAFDEASELFEKALDHVGDADPRQRCRLLLALGDALWRSGRDDAAKARFAEAAEVARALGDYVGLAEAALGYGCGIGGFGFVDSADEALLALLQDALSALDRGDSALRVRVMARLATELYYTNELDRRAALAAEAVAMAERLGDPSVMLVAQVGYHQALQGPSGDEARAAAAADEVVRLATRTNDREMLFLGHRMRFQTRLDRGDLAGARQALDQCRLLSQELRQPFYRWQTRVYESCVAFLDGDIDEAERLAHSAVELDRAGSQIATVVLGAQLLVYAWARCELEEMLPLLEDFSTRYPRLSAWRAAHAFALAGVGEVDRARVMVADFADESLIRPDGNWAIAMTMLAVVAMESGSTSLGELVHRNLLDHRHRFPTALAGVLCIGSAELALGGAAQAMGDAEAAEAHLAASVEADRARGMLPWEAYSAALLARLLSRSEDRNARARAVALAGQAIELGTRTGMRRAVDLALAAKLAVQGLDEADMSKTLFVVTKAAAEEGADLDLHAAVDGTVTIMFSDIEDSTVIAEKLGDEEWLALLREHNTLVRHQLARHGGHEVKAIGDGFMAVFSSARSAVRCAIGIQRTLEDRNTGAEVPLRVRIGLHTGETLQDDDDFFGRNVILASRIAAQAGGAEILVSDVLRAVLSGSSEFAFGESRQLPLKGLAGTHGVHHVDWSLDGALAEPPPPTPTPLSMPSDVGGLTPRARAERLLDDAATAFRDGAVDLHARLRLAWQAAEETSDPEVMARAALCGRRGFWSNQLGSGDDHRIALLEKAVALVEDPGLKAACQAALASELAYHPDSGRRLRLAEEALALARSLGDERVLADVLLAATYGRISPDRADETMADADELFALAGRVGDPDLRTAASVLRFRSAVTVADGEAVRQSAAAAAEAAARGSAVSRWMAAYVDAALALVEGDLDRAERRRDDALALGIECGQPDAGLFWGAQSWQVHAERGRLADLVPMAESGGDREGASFSVARAVYTLALADSGRVGDARGLLLAEFATGFPTPDEITRLTALCVWMEVACRLHEAASATVLYRRLLPYADLVPTTGPASMPPVAYHLGQGARVSLSSGARQHFERARTVAARLGAPRWVARADEALAGL